MYHKAAQGPLTCPPAPRSCGCQRSGYPARAASGRETCVAWQPCSPPPRPGGWCSWRSTHSGEKVKDIAALLCAAILGWWQLSTFLLFKLSFIGFFLLNIFQSVKMITMNVYTSFWIVSVLMCTSHKRFSWIIYCQLELSCSETLLIILLIGLSIHVYQLDYVDLHFFFH